MFRHDYAKKQCQGAIKKFFEKSFEVVVCNPLHTVASFRIVSHAVSHGSICIKQTLDVCGAFRIYAKELELTGIGIHNV